MHALITLPYQYHQLEPYFDATTMEVHHTKHHQTYVDKLNDALKSSPDLLSASLEKLLRTFADLPSQLQPAIRNFGGGAHNHNLFFTTLSPQPQPPQGALSQLITQTFGSQDQFQTQFSQAALGVFGSGWAWLVQTPTGLEIITTPNQDSPLIQGKTPLLGVDVWEHAYYLKYQNRRAEYIAAFWQVADWQVVASRLAS